MKLIPSERPSGEKVRAMRERQTVDHRPMTQEEFGQWLDAKTQQVSDWETEKRGVRMPATTWRLARITFDPRFRALFLREVKTLYGRQKNGTGN